MVACPQCRVGVLFTMPRRISAIVEIAGAILHVVDRPFGDLRGQREAIGIAVTEENQCIDSLRANTGYRSAAFCGRNTAECHSAERTSSSSIRIRSSTCSSKRWSPVCGGVVLEAVQDIGRVEVIDPVQIGALRRNTRNRRLFDDLPCTASPSAPRTGRTRSAYASRCGPADWRRACWHCEPACFASGYS